MHIRMILMLLVLATVASGALFRDGKTLMGTGQKPKVEIRDMQWGQRDATQDRLVGKFRINNVLTLSDVTTPISLNFDVFNASAQKTNTVAVVFTLMRYGYYWRGNYAEGEFCSDFPPSVNARRMTLTSVLYGGESVVYQTMSDISNSMLKNNFTLREPKSIPVNQRGGVR